MRRLLIVAAAVLVYLPAARYGFVQDDRAIVAANPAAQSVGSALAAFDDPYWPRETGAGLYRPATILSYAVDWTISRGRPGWLHAMNALWHGLAVLLLAAVLARWLPPLAAGAAALLFAWHPVHVEAVASIVGRAELLAAVGILGAVLAARRGRWTAAVLCAALAMLSKEHGVIVGVVILLDHWLQGADRRAYPRALWVALGAVTLVYLGVWFAVGWSRGDDVAAVFIGRGAFERLAVALPAVARAAWLLLWPASLSIEYGPRVIPAYTALSFAAVAGVVLVLGVPVLVYRCRQRAPAVSFAAALAALSYLPTSNLLFASGVVLAERNLYLAVAFPAVLAATGMAWAGGRFGERGARGATAVVALIIVACGVRSLDRLPAWRDNRSQLLTLLSEHPEAYRGHGSAAAVLAGLQDTAGTLREYRTADSLFPGDPHLDAAHAFYLLGLGDTARAAPLVARARGARPLDRVVLRARFLLERARGDSAGTRAVADSALARFPRERDWYLPYLQ